MQRAHAASLSHAGSEKIRFESCSQVRCESGTEKSNLPLAFSRIQTIEICDQLFLLAQPERRPVKRLEMSSRILQITFDPHRPQQKPADQDLVRIRDELVLNRATISGLRDDGVRRSPLETNRLSGAVSNGETRALVDGVGEKIHDTSAPRIEIHLDYVPFSVAEEAGLVSLIGSGIVESLLRKAEHRLDVRLGRRRHSAHENGTSKRDKP